MIDPKLIELGKELLGVMEKYSESREVPIYAKPESVPCKHEPTLPISYAVNGLVSIEAYQDLERALISPRCKCGAKLKATGWELA
jgi:hypothetical protein